MSQARPGLPDSLEEHLPSPIYDLLLIRARLREVTCELVEDKVQLIFFWPSTSANDFCSVGKITPNVTVCYPVGRRAVLCLT